MAFELLVNTEDGIEAIGACARHEIPPPVIATYGCIGHCHVLCLAEDHDATRAAIERWWHRGAGLLGGQEVGP